MIRQLSLTWFLSAFLLVHALPAQQAVHATGQKASTAKLSTSDRGDIRSGIYRSPFFGFSYKLPYGWVDRTQEMREDESGKVEDPSKGMVLLAVFERPPQARGETVNSSVVVVAEPASSYPGLKSAAQYFGPLNEVITKQGLKPLNEPYDFPVDARPIVRCDYTGPLGSATMHQSTLAMLARGYVISFTFIGGSDDEVTELLESLSFGKVKSAAPGNR